MSSNSVVVIQSDPPPDVIASRPSVTGAATGTMLNTVFVAGLIRDSVLSHQLVTQTPVASMVTPEGEGPTVTDPAM